MSDTAFVIRNQAGQYWARAGEWIDGREPQRVLKLRYRDEAVNQLVELSARDIELRGAVLECSLGRRGEPLVEPSDLLTPTSAERAAIAAEHAAALTDNAAPEGRPPEGQPPAVDDERAEAREPARAPTV